MAHCSCAGCTFVRMIQSLAEDSASVRIATRQDFYPEDAKLSCFEFFMNMDRRSTVDVSLLPNVYFN